MHVWKDRGSQGHPCDTCRSEGTPKLLPGSDASLKAVGILDALERIGYPGILIDENRMILRWTRQADPYLGREFLVAHGQLKAACPRTNAAFQNVVARALQDRAGSNVAGPIVVNRPSSHPALAQVLVTEISEFAPACVIMLVDVCAERHLSCKALRDVFGLTPAEFRLADELFQGLGLEEIAEKYGIAVNTVRQQLKMVLGKTGTHRQSELIALLARMSLAVNS